METLCAFTNDAKIFVESCCSNVEKMYVVIENKAKFKSLIENFFYSRFIDKMQGKVMTVKLYNYKLHSLIEKHYYINSQEEEEKKKFRKICKKDSENFIRDLFKNSSVIFNTRNLHHHFQIIRIQRSFRLHLKNLILKMENMNNMIELEMRKAEERQKRKSIELRKTKTSK